MVSAWASEQRLVLAAVPTERAATEPVAIPDLLALLELRGATVTVDAIGGRGDGVARAIRAKHAHYLIAIKANAGTLHRYVVGQFAAAAACGFRGVGASRVVTRDAAHGRAETRVVRAMPARGWSHPKGAWADVATLVEVTRTRTRRGRTTTKVHYYVTDLRAGAATLGHRIRRRWSTENEQHWRLDVAFGEDGSRIRDATSATNLAFVRRDALNRHLAMPDARGGLPRRIKRAGWDDTYLERLLMLDLTGT